MPWMMEPIFAVKTYFKPSISDYSSKTKGNSISTRFLIWVRFSRRSRTLKLIALCKMVGQRVSHQLALRSPRRNEYTLSATLHIAFNDDFNSNKFCNQKKLNIYIRGSFNKFRDLFVQAFKIGVDSWKFSMLLLYILWDDCLIFMISGSNELLLQEFEYIT